MIRILSLAALLLAGPAIAQSPADQARQDATDQRAEATQPIPDIVATNSEISEIEAAILHAHLMTGAPGVPPNYDGAQLLIQSNLTEHGNTIQNGNQQLQEGDAETTDAAAIAKYTTAEQLYRSCRDDVLETLQYAYSVKELALDVLASYPDP